MSTNFLNRRMDLIHEFKDGTHYLTMDTSYPVKLNGLVLKLFIATRTYKESEVKNDDNGITFSIKSANNVGDLTYEPMITNIKKSNVFNFNNELLKDDAFVEGDYVMAVIDLFNDKLYICSQTDFAKLVTEGDLSDICNFKMFDLSEETEDRLAMAVAFQKDGTQPTNYKEHFSLTRNGNPTEGDTHGDYTVYQLIHKKDSEDLYEIPVADTYTKSANEISIFIHPFMYLSLIGYGQYEQASLGYCYKGVAFKAIYGYLNNSFVNNFCFDYDFVKDYLLINKDTNQTEFSLYNPNDNSQILLLMENISESSRQNDYMYTLQTTSKGGAIGNYSGYILPIRKSDNLLSYIEGFDINLLYNSKSRFSIDCSGENSKFSGERWGSPASNIKYTYYYKDDENTNYVLKNESNKNMTVVNNKKYFDNDYIIPFNNENLNGIDIVNDPYLFDNDYNSFTPEHLKSCVFNPFVFTNVTFLKNVQGIVSGNFYIEDARHDYYINNYLRNNKKNKEEIVRICLGKPIQALPNYSEDFTYNDAYMLGHHGSSINISGDENQIEYNFRIPNNNRKIFNIDDGYYRHKLYLYTNFQFIKNYNFKNHDINYINFKNLYTIHCYRLMDYMTLSINSNNKIIIELRSNSDLLHNNKTLNHQNANSDDVVNYQLMDNNNEPLTLYSFLNFRMFNFNGDDNTSILDDNDYYYGLDPAGFQSRVLRYKIINPKYNNLYIDYFSSITDNNANNHGISNVFIAHANNARFYRIYIKCKYNNTNHILCITSGDADNNLYNSIHNFSETSVLGHIGIDQYSYCIDSNSRFVNVKNKTFETEYNNQTIKFIFDENLNFKISFNTSANPSVFTTTDIIKYHSYQLNHILSSNNPYNTETEGMLDGYSFEYSAHNITIKEDNYKSDDKYLIESTDDFFILHDDIDDIVDIIEYTTLESQIFNHYANSKDNNTYKLPRIDYFFEDGTKSNRRYSIPCITEELGGTYYKYLNYIKTHSCLELFNIYKDYENRSGDKFSQIKNNMLDKSIYLDDEGNEKTIYEFYRTILKYYGNGKLKNTFPGYEYSFISKNDIKKTITNCEEHDKIRPHYFFIIKQNKDTLDINADKIVGGSFIQYSDNEHGDNCYKSLTSKEDIFEQYIYIKKHGNIGVNLINDSTEVSITFSNKQMFTIGNTFNLYNTSNNKKFEIVSNSDVSNEIIIKTQVPVANIYAVYLQNSISVNSGVNSSLTTGKLYIDTNNNKKLRFDYIKTFMLNSDSIDISMSGNIVEYDDNEKEIDFYNKMNSEKSVDTIYKNQNYLDININGKDGNILNLLLMDKILPKNYFFSVGEKITVTDEDGNEIETDRYKTESILDIKGNFNENNILSSIYVELPKKYQSSDSTIYKTIVETGLRKSQSISLTDNEGNVLSLNGIERKEVDKLTWYDLLIALNNNQYIDILGENLLNLKKTLADNPDIMQDMSDLSGIRNDISDIRDNILAKLKIIKFYHEIPEISIQESTNTVYDLSTIIDNMQSLSCLDLILPETESLITSKYYKDIKVPYYQTIGNVMNDTKVYGGRLTVFKFDDGKIYLEYINKGNDIYFTHKVNIMTDFNDPSIWIKKNSPKVYSEININLDYNKEDFVKTLSDMNPNSTLDITFPFNDDINNLDKTSIIYAGAMIFEANSRANPNFNYNINVTLNCLDEDNTQITLNSVRTDCAGMSEAIVRYLGYNVKHSPDTIGVTVADFYQMTTDAQNISSIRDKQDNISQNFKLIPYSKDKLLPGDLIIYSGRHIEQYIYTDNDGTARGFNAGSSDSMRDSVSLAKYIAENKSVPEFSSHLGATLNNLEGLNIGLETGVNPDYILRYRYINGNNFLPYSMSDDGYLEPGGHLVINALRPNENIINVNIEFTNYRNDKYSKYLIINKIGDLNSYCTFKWLTNYVNLNKLNTILVNWHDAITTKPELTDEEKTSKTNEFKAAYEKLADDDADKKKYDTADKYAEAKLKEYIDGLDEVEKEPAKKEIIYGLSTDDSNHIIEIQSGDYKVLNFNENDKNNDKKELCLKAYSSIEPSIIFENIKNDTTHTRLNSSKLIFNNSICIVDGKRTYNLTVSNPFYNVQKSNSVNKYKEQISIRILYKRVNPNIVDIDSQ